MATSPIPQWAREQSPYNREPTIAGTFFRLFLILAVLVALGAYGPARAWADRQGEKYPSLCAEHAGRPGWQSVCDRERVAEQIRQVRER